MPKRITYEFPGGERILEVAGEGTPPPEGVPYDELPLIDFHPGSTDVIATPGLDAWRKAYLAGELTYADHRRIYERIAVEYPNQNYYAAELAKHFFAGATPEEVFELGGWDGALAAEVLPEAASIQRWTNYEIVKVPQVCTDPRYRLAVPNRFVWELPSLHGDAFFASHVLEHLTAADMEKLLDKLDTFRWAYVDVPLPSEPFDWKGTTTTHALVWSISEFDQAWEERGWRIVSSIFRANDVPSYVRFLHRYPRVR